MTIARNGLSSAANNLGPIVDVLQRIVPFSQRASAELFKGSVYY